MASHPATPKLTAPRLVHSGVGTTAEEETFQTAARSVPEADTAPTSSGFDGHLRGTSLADLIQLECLSGVRTSVAVRSDGRLGRLYFERGNIAHAIAGDLHGDAAVLEILSWDTGTFGNADGAWPERSPVTAPWQQLLMIAAQRRDESERYGRRHGAEARSDAQQGASRVEQASSLRAQSEGKSAQRLVPLPSTRISSAPAKPKSSNQLAANDPTLPHPVNPHPASTHAAGSSASSVQHDLRLPEQQPGRSLSGSEQTLNSARGLSTSQRTAGGVEEALPSGVTCALRLDNNGEVLAVRGAGLGRVDLFAYLRRLVDLIGADLGLNGFHSLECQLRGHKLMLFTDTQHSFVAIEAAADADLASARRALGY